MQSNRAPVIIVGGGVAGLCCAVHLHTHGIPCRILEASDRIGGRVKTDVVEGFLLDHGFLVLQTGYPEARRLLDYEALALQRFVPGACVRLGGRFHRIADPIRTPRYALETLFAPIGTMGDKLRMLRLVKRASQGSVEDLFDLPESSTIGYLRKEGFSERIIARFFRPFFSGVYLDQQIRASSRTLMFLFRMFARADVALPSQGMGAIPAQLASRIPEDSIWTNARVKSLQDGIVNLETGEALACETVVLATQGPESARLLADRTSLTSCPVTCLYYSAPRPPLREGFLVLNSEARGPINSMCFISNVAPSYAPSGRTLTSVTTLRDSHGDEAELEREVRTQLVEWYGAQATSWRHLKTYSIDHALPLQVPPAPNPARVNPRVQRGIYVCGEYGSIPGIQWAMLSGRLAAESIMRDRGFSS